MESIAHAHKESFALREEAGVEAFLSSSIDDTKKPPEACSKGIQKGLRF